MSNQQTECKTSQVVLPKKIDMNWLRNESPKHSLKNFATAVKPQKLKHPFEQIFMPTDQQPAKPLPGKIKIPLEFQSEEKIDVQTTRLAPGKLKNLFVE